MKLHPSVNGTKLAAKLGPQRIHTIRARGGNKKYRALCLDQGNFSWGSEAITRKTRIIAVVYNAVNNELVSTKTLVKNATIVIDASPQPIHTVRVHGGNKKYCAFCEGCLMKRKKLSLES